MAHDREVLRMIWEAQIAICFQADAEEVVGLQQPENFYLMVSRLSYLPLVTDKVKKYFHRYIANEQLDGNVWFDYNGAPLKLHYPIGVLYDLLHHEEDGVPWCLTIHFSKFPEDVLVKFTSKDVLESHFMSCLKEADVLKHRGQVISSMQKKDHNQLWLGLLNDKFDQFWAVNRRLMEPNADQEFFKHIPIRFYNDDTTYMQKLVLPINDAGEKRTLHDVLAEISTPVRKAGKYKLGMSEFYFPGFSNGHKTFQYTEISSTEYIEKFKISRVHPDCVHYRKMPVSLVEFSNLCALHNRIGNLGDLEDGFLGSLLHGESVILQFINATRPRSLLC